MLPLSEHFRIIKKLTADNSFYTRGQMVEYMKSDVDCLIQCGTRGWCMTMMCR
jgi:hypothetical protein